MGTTYRSPFHNYDYNKPTFSSLISRARKRFETPKLRAGLAAIERPNEASDALMHRHISHSLRRIRCTRQRTSGHNSSIKIMQVNEDLRTRVPESLHNAGKA
ncbi:unnamed protein product [Pieris brassicae]|uniref:Uncharacterized protein n=1 Tax=Pieris brassicae TaxID=7116 RepID=A0A9P0WV04_PIEBR|nr:unnamed protein product [Pieris brassicae]